MTHRKHAAALLTAVLLLAHCLRQADRRRIRSRTDACGPGR